MNKKAFLDTNVVIARSFPINSFHSKSKMFLMSIQNIIGQALLLMNLIGVFLLNKRIWEIFIMI